MLSEFTPDHLKISPLQSRPDLRAIGASNTLEARAIAGGMIVSWVDTTGWKIFTGDVGADELAIAVRRHHARRSLVYRAHNHIGIVNGHVFVVDLGFATAQEIGQVDRQKAYASNTLS